MPTLQPGILHLQINKSRQIQKKVGELKDTQVDREEAEIFTLTTLTKTREKMKIDRKYFRMQVDTGHDITIIPVKFWQDLEKPRFKKSTLLLKRLVRLKLRITLRLCLLQSWYVLKTMNCLI